MATRAARRTPATAEAAVAGAAGAAGAGSPSDARTRGAGVRSVSVSSAGAALEVVQPPAVAAAEDGPGRRRARRGSTSDPGQSEAAEGRNEVRLLGRLGVGVRELTMPSGDRVNSFHLVVSRPPRSKREQERRPREPTVDTLACAAWSSRCRRSVSAAQPGDLLEVEGALRRRFRRSAAGSPVSFYEIEVASVRRVRRSDS